MSKTRKYIRFALSGFMTVWLSGIVFLVCCVAITSTEKNHCPLAKASASAHCEKGKADTAPFLHKSPDGSVFNCCGFIPAVFDKARKLQTNDPVLATKPAPIADRVDFLPSHSTPRQSPIYSGLVVQKNRTYLKNRILRI